MGMIDDWYDEQIARFGSWLASRPERRAVEAKVGCGSGRATELLRRATTPRQIDRPTIVFFGDAHAEPGQSLRRFRLAGRIMRTLRPIDHAVFMGDFFGLTSACSHSDAQEREGRRIKDDIDFGNRAIAVINEECPIGTGPQRHALGGNHEDPRLRKLEKEHPEYTGLVGPHMFEWEQNGWAVYPFKTDKPLRIEGWRAEHYYMTRGKSTAMSGMHLAAKLIGKNGTRYEESMVVGHTHTLDYAQAAKPSGGRVHGIVCGKWFEQRDYDPDYATPDAKADWWAGAVFVRSVRGTDGSISFESMRDLYEQYGPDLC